MKTLLTILGIFTALSAQAGIEKSVSMDSYRIELAGAKSVSVVISAEVENCGADGLWGALRPVPGPEGSEVQVIYADLSPYSMYHACNPFIPRTKRLVSSDPLTIYPAEGAEYVKLIVPAGYLPELLPLTPVAPPGQN